MSETLHAKAQRLLHESLVEGVAAADERWLFEHLAACDECTQEAATMRALLAAMKSVPVVTPRDLAARTKLRLHLRTQEAPAGGSLWLWIVTAASWGLGVFSAPLVWRLFSWAGSELHAPRLAVELSFGLWWLVPALAAVAVVLHQRTPATKAKGH